MSDTYSAKANNNVTLRNLLQNDAKDTSYLIIFTQVLLVLCSAIVIIMVLVVFFCSKSHIDSRWKKKVKANKLAVLSFTILSVIINVYIFCLACTSVSFWYIKKDEELRILYDLEKKRNEVPVLIVLFVDFSLLIGWLSTVLIAARKQNWLYLSFTVLCPIFCVIAHSPYIAIAYLNDGFHASSIFIYYTIIGFLLYGVMRLFFKWCENVINSNSETENIKFWKCCCIIFKWCENVIGSSKFTDSTEIIKFCKCCCITVCMAGTIFCIIGLVVTIACYFVLIPINRSISDASNRLLSIYQSGGFLIGSFILYKVIEYFYHEEKEVTLKDLDNRLVTLKDIDNRLVEMIKDQKESMSSISTTINQIQEKLGRRPSK